MSLPTSANNSVKVRPSLRLSLLAIALGFSQVSCGAPELSCGTGDSIVLGYQALPTGWYASFDAVVIENGAPYFFVDQSCRYWVQPGRQTYDPVHQGQLTEEQLARLNRDIMTRDWNAIRNAKPGPIASDFDGAPQYIWRDTSVGTCEAGCPDVVSSPISAARGLMDDLWAAGAAMDSEAPMRWRIQADSGSIAIAPVLEWKGTSSLAELADPTTFSDFGNAPVVSGPDAALVRADLATLRAGYDGLPYVLFYTENDIRYRVYARDALPFEDERGLVRPPGIDWGVE